MSRETKLDLSDVVDIRRLHAAGSASSTLAKSYGISVRHVNNIVTGNKWSSVPQDRLVKGFTNYAVTPDGRVWSFTKNGYLTVESGTTVRLQKIDKSGNRVCKRVSIAKLVQTYF